MYDPVVRPRHLPEGNESMSTKERTSQPQPGDNALSINRIWTNMWSVHKVEYHSATNRNKLPIHVTTGMELKA